MTCPAPFATEQELAGIEADRAATHAEAVAESKVDIARVEDVDAGGVPARLYVPDQPVGAGSGRSLPVHTLKPVTSVARPSR